MTKLFAPFAASLAAFCTVSSAVPVIDSVDYTAVPIGEEMTFTGSGFSDTQSVSFFWASGENPATFQEIEFRKASRD